MKIIISSALVIFVSATGCFAAETDSATENDKLTGVAATPRESDAKTDTELSTKKVTASGATGCPDSTNKKTDTELSTKKITASGTPGCTDIPTKIRFFEFLKQNGHW